MRDQAGRDSEEPWYSARCVFCHRIATDQKTYEERVILLRAEREEEATRLAEEEAEEYAAAHEACSYTGLIDLFHLFETEIGHGAEIFSLMRSSALEAKEYLDRYYDTGCEHSRRTPSKP